MQTYFKHYIMITYIYRLKSKSLLTNTILIYCCRSDNRSWELVSRIWLEKVVLRPQARIVRDDFQKRRLPDDFSHQRRLQWNRIASNGISGSVISVHADAKTWVIQVECLILPNLRNAKKDWPSLILSVRNQSSLLCLYLIRC